MLQGRAQVGKRVAVIGAGGIGFDVSEFIIHAPGEVKPSENIREFYKEWGIDPTYEVCALSRLFVVLVARVFVWSGASIPPTKCVHPRGFRPRAWSLCLLSAGPLAQLPACR